MSCSPHIDGLSALSKVSEPSGLPTALICSLECMKVNVDVIFNLGGLTSDSYKVLFKYTDMVSFPSQKVDSSLK